MCSPPSISSFCHTVTVWLSKWRPNHTCVISIFTIVSAFVLWSNLSCRIRYWFHKRLAITHRLSGERRVNFLSSSISLKVYCLLGMLADFLFVQASLFTKPLLYFFITSSFMFLHQISIENLFFTNEDCCFSSGLEPSIILSPDSGRT